MPSSRPNTIPTIVHLIQQLQPKSILDVGVGFGKWGHLFREYTDIREAERDPRRYEKRHWQVRIDGIEGHAAYLTEMHRYLYDAIHVGDARQLIKTLPRYDVIFLGDVIEHFEKAAGEEFLRDAVARADKAVIVSTPRFETGQPDLCGNELERHRSLWAARDFRGFPGAQVRTVDRATLVAVIAQPGAPPLEFSPPRQPRAAAARRLAETRAELAGCFAPGDRFILVDQEQLRPDLPFANAVPFLERDGQYWGPPPDDATAIRELERMRAAGARHLAFVWSAFWWLEHYAGFARHLRDRYRVLRKNELLVVFDLGAGNPPDLV